MGVLAYLGILSLIPLFAAKDSKFVRFHTGQGVTLFAFNFAYSILVFIINLILSFALPATYYYGIRTPNPAVSVVSSILWLGSVFFFVLAIIGIVNVVNKKMEKLPVIGNIDFISKLIDK